MNNTRKLSIVVTVLCTVLSTGLFGATTRPDGPRKSTAWASPDRLETTVVGSKVEYGIYLDKRTDKPVFSFADIGIQAFDPGGNLCPYSALFFDLKYHNLIVRFTKNDLASTVRFEILDTAWPYGLNVPATLFDYILIYLSGINLKNIRGYYNYETFRKAELFSNIIPSTEIPSDSIRDSAFIAHFIAQQACAVGTYSIDRERATEGEGLVCRFIPVDRSRPRRGSTYFVEKPAPPKKSKWCPCGGKR